VRLALVAAASAAVLLWGQTASASGAGATLGVSVTVVKSCSVQARAVDLGAGTVRLTCSSGHVSRVRLGSPSSIGQLAAPGDRVHTTALGESSSTTPDVRIVTVNF
jgi:hypothetical protein